MNNNKKNRQRENGKIQKPFIPESIINRKLICCLASIYRRQHCE